jgi:murein L,D-transpeptidase YcbB/YkuD
MKNRTPLSTQPAAFQATPTLIPQQPASCRLTRYSCTALLALFFFSCQRELTQTTVPAANAGQHVTSASPATPAEKFVGIDTFQLPLATRIALAAQQHPGIDSKMQDKLKRFYTAHAFKTKWLEENTPGVLYHAFVQHLKHADHYGLNPADYNIEQLEEKLAQVYNAKPVATQAVIDLDLQVTGMFFIFAKHLRDGRITGTGHAKNVWIQEKRKDSHADVAALEQITNASQLSEAIDRLQPAHEQYAKLKKALDFYRSLEQSTPSSALIRASQKIKPEERHNAIPLIREKLSATDGIVYAAVLDSRTGLADSLLYDFGLVAAVKVFQQRHGLTPDGVIGEKTVKFLNQSFKEKADLIALNMERMRWLPKNYSDRSIIVNIPDYKLTIRENNQQTLEMKVIVGATGTPSPVFHDTLEHVVFSPTWTVPPSIVKEEILPRLRKDSTYYAQKNFSFFKHGVEIDPATESWDSVFSVSHYRVVQNPGPDNSLGLVKFIMPNSMNVYLHDTPDHTLFLKNYRALSHGCIRLDDPARFAEYLLRNQHGWDLQTINKAMHSGKATKVLLKNSYAVHLEYQTVWVDENGQVHFREDIYGHDKQQLLQLRQPKKGLTAAGVVAKNF